MGTLLGPKYIPYTYMDPLGLGDSWVVITWVISGTALEISSRFP